jgi:NADPH-dependent 2,4-dienoyl-CoA reductase/sulfur reductase-like enzyme
LINIEGLLPGNEVVVVGSGDIGLIMARRFVLEGAKVKAVIEIQKESRGLIRNIVQCVEDFDIPLYLEHKITRIYGKDRVEGVEVAGPGSSFNIACDTVLISVGLIPENELIEMAGGLPIPGLFVCGNAFKVYDLADSVSRDSASAGKLAAEYLKGLK